MQMSKRKEKKTKLIIKQKHEHDFDAKKENCLQSTIIMYIVTCYTSQSRPKLTNLRAAHS